MKFIKTLVYTDRDKEDTIVLELRDSETDEMIQSEFFRVSQLPENVQESSETAQATCEAILADAYPEEELVLKFIVYKELWMDGDKRMDNTCNVQAITNESINTGDLKDYAEIYPDRKMILDEFIGVLTTYINS